MDTRYSIYFETNIPRKDSTERIHKCCELLQGYTLIETTGMWEGTISEAWIVEAIGDASLSQPVNATAKRIKFEFQQYAVLTTAQSIIGELV